MDALKSIMKTAASGMHVQGQRLKVISENVANAESTASIPGGDPYRRKVIEFDQMVDKATGANVVTVKRVTEDRSDFTLVYNPSHPAADEKGFVKMPNVNTLIEMTDSREATRSYEANMNLLESGRSMMAKTIDLLK